MSDQLNTYLGGYFIKRDDISSASYTSTSELYITHDNLYTLKEKIIKLIKEANSSLKICSFIVSDAEIYAELLNKLKTSETAVFILTQLDQNKLSASLLSEDLVDNFNQKHIDYIGRLYENGAHVRAAKSAHAKFIISDNEKVLAMSANLTEPSLNLNPESGVIIDHPEAIIASVELFDVIYQYGTEFTKFKSASGNKQFIVSRDISLNNDWLTDLSNGALKFTWGEGSRSLLDSILEHINSAGVEEPILISTYSVVGLGNIPEFTTAIANYFRRGGKIKLFCRGMNYRSDHLKNCQSLAKLGVEIYGDIFNHSKGIITKNSGLIFTANIDGNHGLINGFEVGYKLEGRKLNGLKEFIQWQIDSAPFIFKLNPSKNELITTYNYYTQAKEIVPISISNDIVFQVKSQEVGDELMKYPIYLFFGRSSELNYISINDSYYQVRKEGDNIIVGLKVNRVLGFESYLHMQEEISVSINTVVI